MEQENLRKRISELESLNDQLQSELRYLDELLKRAGFDEGLKSLKAAAIEILEDEESK